MKKLIILGMVIILVPQIVLAAWWNPFSWFNNWNFSNPTEKIQNQALKNRINELEEKINDQQIVATSTATTTVEDKVKSVAPVAQPKSVSIKPAQPKTVPISTAPPIIYQQPNPVVTPPVSPAIIPAPVVQSPKDFRAKCVVSKDTIDEGDSVETEIDILFENNSDYEITWDKKYLTRKIDNNQITPMQSIEVW